MTVLRLRVFAPLREIPDYSLHPQHQSLQVFAFRVVDTDRVISRLGELVKYPHISLADGSRTENSFSEFLLRNDL